MATTTNFGWETPDDTDLVKDGAAAMRTLGNSIDTSFVDLKGGTTGQVLSKASNTDLDYTWVTTDDANAIQNAIVDAKGDLIAASANDTPARLAVGNNGETLVADSSTSTGLRYTEPLNLNPILNSGFDIWQRGTSIAQTAGIVYSADRWCSSRGGFDVGSTISRQATGDTTNLPNIQYCARVQRNSGTTSANIIYFSQTIESVNSIPYAGKTVTFSFYARAGANYSSASNALSITLNSGTGTDQNILSTYTGGANVIATQTATLTTTWQRFTYTGTVATTATELGFYFNYTPVGTAGAADYFEITGVMINVGSVAYPFRRTTGTIQGELAACQYYYQRFTNNQGNSLYGSGFATSTTAGFAMIKLNQAMRTVPSFSASGNFIADDGNSNLTVTTFAQQANGSSVQSLKLTYAGTGMTQYRPNTIQSNGGSFEFSAEL